MSVFLNDLLFISCNALGSSIIYCICIVIDISVDYKTIDFYSQSFLSSSMKSLGELVELRCEIDSHCRVSYYGIYLVTAAKSMVPMERFLPAGPSRRTISLLYVLHTSVADIRSLTRDTPSIANHCTNTDLELRLDTRKTHLLLV